MLISAFAPFPTMFSEAISIWILRIRFVFGKGLKYFDCLSLLKGWFNTEPFPKWQILDSDLKDFADNKLKFNENGVEFFKMAENNVWIGRNCLSPAIFPFSYSVSKRTVWQTHKNKGLFGKGLISQPWVLNSPEVRGTWNLWKREKMLVTNILSFSTIFSTISDTNCIIWKTFYCHLQCFKGGPSDLGTYFKKILKNHPYTPKAFKFSVPSRRKPSDHKWN